MLDAKTKTRIDSARDILVGKVPDPKSQVEKITIALSYKFMDDMDHQSRNWAARRRSSPATSRSTVGLHQQGLGGGATQMTTKNRNQEAETRDLFVRLKPEVEKVAEAISKESGQLNL